MYFGYGANSQREMMEAITGNANLVGREAILKGFKLCVQRRDQVPDVIFPSSPVQISPKKIIEENWGKKFETYMIKSGQETDEVIGTIWELSLLERELVRDWELIELGWYKDAKGEAVLKDGKKIEIETYVLGDNQEIDRIVDGKEYNSFLSRPEDFLRVIEIARREYLERLSVGKEKLSKV